MSEASLVAIRELLAQCTAEEQSVLFRELRGRHRIHEFEEVIGASAETILDAVHRAPELTRRMLRGVIADAAFRSSPFFRLQISGGATSPLSAISPLTTSWTMAEGL